MVHCVCIIHFIITFFFTGFVAHHYNENIGIILTVKGEIVIFEKSVVFKQEGYHDWCKIDQVQQLTVGSYVKLRKHPSNVAEKVWSCHDFGTLEPSRPASTNVKGIFFDPLRTSICNLTYYRLIFIKGSHSSIN